MANEPPTPPKLPHESTETLSLTGDLDLEKQLQDNSSSAGPNSSTGVVSEKGSVGPHVLSLDEAANPRNWSTQRKIIYNIILCTWVLALTYASTAYIASVPELMARFNISPVVAILGVTLTVLGFAAGPLVFAPASEVVGRRPVYILCGLLFSAFSWGAAEADQAPAMLVCRFFLGFFGAASINNVPASIGDFTFPHNRNRYSIVYATMAFGGPALGPLCSAYIERYAGFRWNLRVMAIFITITSILTAFVPETHGPTLLARQVARAGHAPPSAGFAKVVGVYKVASSRPIIFLFTEPIVTLISIYLSTLYGILYGFFQAFSVVFIEIRGFSTTEYGNSYIALGLGFLMGALLLATVGDRLYSHFSRVAAPNPVPPEARLGLAYFGAIVSPISIFLFAWTAPYPSIHWIVPLIAEALFAMSMLCIFTAFIPYLIDVYTQYAASALAAGMASRALIGSVFPLFALQMYRQLTVQGATSLLAGLSVCLAPIPFVFAKYGPQLREKSRYSN